MKKCFIDSVLMFLIVLAFAGMVRAQDAGIWDWVEDKTWHDSMVHLKATFPQEVDFLGRNVVIDAEAYGSGAVIAVDKNRPSGAGYRGLVVTARHCVVECVASNRLVIEFAGGKKSTNCEVIAMSDERTDIAIVECDVPQGIEPMSVEDSPLKPNDAFEFCGYGGMSSRGKVRHWKGRAALPTDNKRLFANDSFIPGDSGGVAIRDGVVVGVCNGGCVWWAHPSMPGKKITWPARMTQSYCVVELLKKTRWQGKVEIR